MNKNPVFDVVSQIVDEIIEHAISGGASDIHFESNLQGLRIRLRIDGVLHEYTSVDPKHARQVIARIKVLSHIDVAQSRVPQDGKFRVGIASPVDLRVSTFPSVYGEKVVIRILRQEHDIVLLEHLGMRAEIFEKFRYLLSRPGGFFLVSGPTGSGKTTTLYAVLSELNSIEDNIITLEDPVECYLPGVTQGQVNNAAGFDFYGGMRAILRQDPDIVLIGEMRDRQTAQIAMQASLTGHMVLSTIHTNDAPSVIVRLVDMGIEPFLINASLTGVVAQRLARKLCATCKQAKKPDRDEEKIMERLGFAAEVLFVAHGCTACFNLGYRGRTGIFELLEISEKLKGLIIDNYPVSVLRAQAVLEGMETMAIDAAIKLNSGIISLTEYIRVIGI